jgi:integrase
MALTDTFVKTIKAKPKGAGDKYADGGGMYLLVKQAGKYWRLNYRFLGKRKTLALGVYPALTLADARKLRDKAKAELVAGDDPSQAKRERIEVKKTAAASTFETVARDWIAKPDAKRGALTLAKIDRWLSLDVYPYIGKMPIGQITAKVLLDRVLTRIEARNALDKAHRVKAVCGQVFRFAVAKGLAERDPTGDLRGAIGTHEVEHHSAITEPKALGMLLRAMGGYQGHPITQTALNLAPLLFVRPGEMRHAEWSEIDFEAASWLIPASKMKMKVEHLVPLSKQSVELLKALQPITGHGKYVFPSLRTGERPMSENTVNAALRAIGYSGDVHTGHGFRATARTILDQVLAERVDLIEHQLAHAVKDANGRAYNRTTHLPARVKLMQRWADYLDTLRAGENVIPITAKRA